ncbi:ubiquitin-conjugating enzyme E2 G1-like isoform X1 [Sinocyclocheilus rhinocerous]|uniref:ubiquitin-conjugating enzyme E2 G1-like isoform X1 n=2 Tax=Sinocyclocheilus TaxID=75365 RepID=UPI0007B950BA|nr:PREDICTED: ubiquitin-conjugating enzyme E2 G1-like isoform X1 [Sinocyclocheilus rhinocerous]
MYKSRAFSSVSHRRLARVLTSVSGRSLHRRTSSRYIVSLTQRISVIGPVFVHRLIMVRRIKIVITRRKELNKNPVEGFSAGLIDDNDLYRWEVLIIGPPDTLFEGGVFKAHLTFPKDYPLRPPKMKFITEIWHPNVDKNGDVCISILHEPGEDKYGYEKPEERWLPIHTVETIMISVISMLADPNGDSPANVDAAKEWREDRHGEFKRKVARCVRKSQETAFE